MFATTPLTQRRVNFRNTPSNFIENPPPEVTVSNESFSGYIESDDAIPEKGDFIEDQKELIQPTTKFYFYEVNGAVTITTQRCRVTTIIPVFEELNYSYTDQLIHGRVYKRRVPLCRGGMKRN